MRTDYRKLTPPSTNGLLPTNNARPMHCANGRTRDRKKYINMEPEAHHHKTNCEYPIRNLSIIPETAYTATIEKEIKKEIPYKEGS